MSTLTDRLRSIVRAPGLSDPGLRALPGPTGLPVRPDVESVLGGEWRQIAGASCFVVERWHEPAMAYGGERLERMAASLAESSAEAVMVGSGIPARPPFVFFDLETTGLSGGAGTFAFLVGCGWFDDDAGFVTRQFVLARIADERALLVGVAAELGRAGALVSFNGKSFDAPVLEMRYLFHRLDWIVGRLPHLDVLHPARRFWSGCGGAGTDCSLIALERRVLGLCRIDDVPGFEIPSRYFQFLRLGDARPLVGVLEHNRLDLLSLAGITARLLHLVRVGPSKAANAREALALGRTYARVGLESRAIDAYRAALARGASTILRIDVLRSLALMLRRSRRFEEASACWRQLLDVPGCPTDVVREANESLAIHNEHRVRDLDLARTFALRNLDEGRHSPWNQAVQHRLARIERKIGKRDSRPKLQGTVDLRLET